MVSRNVSTNSFEAGTSSVTFGTISNAETPLTSSISTTETSISVTPRQNISLPTTNSTSVQPTSKTSTTTTKNNNKATTTSKTDQTVNLNAKSTEIEIQIGFSAKFNITENGHNHGFSSNAHCNDDEDMLCGTLYQHDHFVVEFKKLYHRGEIKSLGNGNNILSSLKIHHRK